MTTNANDLPAHEAATPAGVAHPARLAPGPQGSRLLGNLPALMRKGVFRFVVDAWRAYGDIFHMRLGYQARPKAMVTLRPVGGMPMTLQSLLEQK